MKFFKNNKIYKLTLKIIYQYLPLILFIAYPLLVLYVFFYRQSEIFKVILIPLGVFLFVTIFRKMINEQRPYEKYQIPSLFNKTKKGESMPSRHTASAFIIAMAFLYIDFDLGVSALAIASLIGLSRVLAGVHFIRDVLVGVGISIAVGTVFFFLI